MRSGSDRAGVSIWTREASPAAKRGFAFVDGAGEAVDDLAAQGAAAAVGGAGNLAGLAVEPRRQRGGIKRLHFLGEQAAEDAAEDVAGAGLGEGGVAGGVEVDAAAVGDDGAAALEDDCLVEGGCGGGGDGDAGVFVGGDRAVGDPVAGGGFGEELGEAAHLAGVGGEDGGGLEPFWPALFGSEEIEGVGVDDGWLFERH
jgi:hypothetical protein